MATIWSGESSLEEQVLRALYEGPASARECAAELTPFSRPSANRIHEVACLLDDLARRAGCERLADLVE